MDNIEHHPSCEPESIVEPTLRAAIDRSSDVREVRWLPWVGEAYGRSTLSGGKRLLILGASHYEWCEKHWHTRQARGRDLTCRCVAERVVLDNDKTIQHWKNVEYAVAGAPLDNKARADFWHSLGYYNFVQDIVGYYGGGDARPKPTPAMWANSKPAFLGVLERLMPDAVIVLGNMLWERLPEGPEGRLPELRAGGKTLLRCTYVVGDRRVVACRVPHPAAGLGVTWHPAICEAIKSI